MIAWFKKLWLSKTNIVLEHRKYTTKYEDLCM